MAQFYANIKGNRGEATRMGTKDSGLQAHLRGWDIGVEVRLIHLDGVDRIEVWTTGGSNNPDPVGLVYSLQLGNTK